MILKIDNRKDSRQNTRNTNDENYYSDGIRNQSIDSTSATHVVQSKVDQMFVKTNSLSRHMIDCLPTFHLDELELGKILGSGSFSEVYEIKSIKVLHQSQDGLKVVRSSLLEDKTESLDSFEERKFENAKEFITKNTRRMTGDARFAIKYLSPHIVEDNSLCVIGATDLAMEVMILSNLNHQNIIKLRGVSATGFDEIGSAQGYFLVLDRLYDTLEQKLHKWKADLPKWNLLKSKEQKVKFSLRLIAAFDLASALEYLHDQKIIYRDLKAQNVGFDARGDIKLFDFGLAKELKEEYRTKTGNYKLTSNTGTRRYMAPEVALNDDYNLSADVHSFAILLWEICALKRAYKGFSYESHLENALIGNTRPSIKKNWPSSIKLLLESMWSKQASERPEFKAILPIIEKYVLKHIKKSSLKSSSQRSTFLRL